MRKLIAMFAVVSLLGAGAAVAFGATTKTVNWKKPSNTFFGIKKGDTIKWVWGDKKNHNVRGPGLSSKFSKTKGHVVKKTFKNAGTFVYVCDVHADVMKTRVQVR
jgi:plastocyanin